ncbi:MAG: tRNA pseudouridine(55) synthase TruB [Bacteroidota bacterium]
MTAFDFTEGKIILINKPKNWTSFDVIKKMRHVIRETYRLRDLKIGHAGTLDPLATGLLIICIGKETKNIFKFQDMEKEYTGTFMLGVTSPSYDMETAIENRYPIQNITKQILYDTAKKFIGPQLQIPPSFSAKKIKGIRAYLNARKGIQQELKPVSVFIDEFKINDVNLPLVDFKVVCSKGTYIRSLANDFGRELGCGSLLSSLCRTRIGKYKIEDAEDILDWEKKMNCYAVPSSTNQK